eukprot:gene6458-157_t
MTNFAKAHATVGCRLFLAAVRVCNFNLKVWESDIYHALKYQHFYFNRHSGDEEPYPLIGAAHVGGVVLHPTPAKPLPGNPRRELGGGKESSPPFPILSDVDTHLSALVAQGVMNESTKRAYLEKQMSHSKNRRLNGESGDWIGGTSSSDPPPPERSPFRPHDGVGDAPPRPRHGPIGAHAPSSDSATHGGGACDYPSLKDSYRHARALHGAPGQSHHMRATAVARILDQTEYTLNILESWHLTAQREDLSFDQLRSLDHHLTDLQSKCAAITMPQTTAADGLLTLLGQSRADVLRFAVHKDRPRQPRGPRQPRNPAHPAPQHPAAPAAQPAAGMPARRVQGPEDRVPGTCDYCRTRRSDLVPSPLSAAWPHLLDGVQPNPFTGFFASGFIRSDCISMHPCHIIVCISFRSPYRSKRIPNLFPMLAPSLYFSFLWSSCSGRPVRPTVPPDRGQGDEFHPFHGSERQQQLVFSLTPSY